MFGRVDEHLLHAIELNFEALNSFLFTKTSFSLLTKFNKSGRTKAITTDWTDALYDLSKEGLGNAREVGQLMTALDMLTKVQAHVVADCDEGQLEWLARGELKKTEIVPFVATELSSYGWTLLIDAKAPDTLGAAALSKSFRHSWK